MPDLLIFLILTTALILWRPPAPVAWGTAFLSLILYINIGTPALPDFPANTTPATKAEKLEKLQSRLSNQPEHLLGWVALARAWEDMDQPEKAAKAWDMAIKLAPTNPQIRQDGQKNQKSLGKKQNSATNKR